MLRRQRYARGTQIERIEAECATCHRTKSIIKYQENQLVMLSDENQRGPPKSGREQAHNLKVVGSNPTPATKSKEPARVAGFLVFVGGAGFEPNRSPQGTARPGAAGHKAKSTPRNHHGLSNIKWLGGDAQIMPRMSM